MITMKDISHLSKFNVRLKVSSDKDVYLQMCIELDNYCKELKSIDSNLAATAILLKDGIIKCFEKYYQGNLIEACKTMHDLITTYKDDLYIHTLTPSEDNINMYSDIHKDLYKGIIGDYTQQIDREYILHIPFDKRHLITTQRFSIPGVPCLYLGQSLIAVWEELNRPTLDNLYVSRFELDENIRIFDLSLNWFDLKSTEELAPNTLTPSLLRKFLLNNIFKIACLIRVTQNNRHFKSEYIIPQLLFIAISNTDLAEGIRYSSAKAPNDSYIFANYALVAIQKNFSPHTEKLSAELKNLVKCTYPINIGMYQKVHPLKPDDFDTRNLYKRNTPIAISDDYKCLYEHTDFYRIETDLYYDESLELKSLNV